MVNQIIVDPSGAPVIDPVAQTLTGLYTPSVGRMLWALPLTQSGLTRRYATHPPAESALFGVDFSFVVPCGVAIATASLAIFGNTFEPKASSDWTAGPVTIDNRRVYARLTGGIEQNDYQLRWAVTDSDGNSFTRTTLCLVAQTS